MAYSTAEETAPGIRKALGYFGAFVALGLASAAMGPVLPRLAEQAGVTLSAVSLLFTVRSLGYLLGSVGAGRLYDRKAAHVVMAAALAAIALALAGLPVASALWLLALLAFVVGLGEGGVDVGGNALLVWVYGNRVGPIMNALHFFFGVGAFLTPLFVAQAVLITGSYAWAFRLIALLTVPILAWLLAQPGPTPHKALEQEASNGSDRTLVGLIVLFLLLYVGAEASFGGWILTYATRQGLAPETTAAYLTSAFWAALTAGRLLAIPLARRWSPGKMLIADLVGCLVSMAVIVIWPGSAIALWAGAIGLGLSMASVFPTAITLAGSLLALTGRITGWFLVGASGGAMLVPWLIGQLFERIGPRSAMTTILIDLALMALLFGVLQRRIRQMVQAKQGESI